MQFSPYDYRLYLKKCFFSIQNFLYSAGRRTAPASRCTAGGAHEWSEDAKHDDGFRLRDLFRELKEAPEYGLRLNQFFQDRSFQRQQERNFDQLLGKWIILARKTPGWNEGEFLELGKAIIQSLRDAYWRACKVDVEAVHRKMDKDDRAHDKFFQHVTDQLSEREKYRNRYGATFFAGRAGTFAQSGPGIQSTRSQRPPYGNYGPSPTYRQLCYNCRSPEHIIKDCPYKRSSLPDFRQRAAGSAFQGAKTL